MHTSIVTSTFSGVPGAGLHLDIKSGRGLPTAFLMTSVINEESASLRDQFWYLKLERA